MQYRRSSRKKHDVWPSRIAWHTVQRKQFACQLRFATCNINRSVIRSPHKLHSVDIILALDPDVPLLSPEPPPIMLFVWKQSGLPWWFNGGGGGNDDIGGDNVDAAMDAAGST